MLLNRHRLPHRVTLLEQQMDKSGCEGSYVYRIKPRMKKLLPLM